MKATKRDLIGRRIIGVEWRPFPDGKGRTATNPALILDNGRRVYFTTQETEIGEYGTEIGITPKEAK